MKTPEWMLKISLPRVKMSSLWGLFYGLGLMNISVAISGAGHGLYFPLTTLNVFAFPVIPALAVWAAKHRRWLIFVPLMLLHYVAAVVFGTRIFREESGNIYGSFPDKLHALGASIAALAVIYLIGQALLWCTFAKSSRSQLSSV